MTRPNQQRDKGADTDDCNENNENQLQRQTLAVPPLLEGEYAADLGKRRLKGLIAY